MASKQALVFGASGIGGWAIVREALQYPTSTTFSRVIAVTRKSLDKADYQLSDEEASRVVQAEIDLMHDADAVTRALQAVPGIQNTTHVFFAAYAGHGSDADTVKRLNVQIVETALQATTASCPNLAFWTLQTGGKVYGLEFFGQPGVTIEAPFKESTPRLPEPYASKIFYYAQYDAVKAASEKAGNKWAFAELRPDIIIGYSPRSGAIEFATNFGLYLSLYRHIHGEGAEVPFPGNALIWATPRGETSQDVLARFHIHIALQGDKNGNGRSYNITDEDSTTWKVLWKPLCALFGLTGLDFEESIARAEEPKGLDWVIANKDALSQMNAQYGLRSESFEAVSWGAMVMVFQYAMFDRRSSLDAAKGTGFDGFRPTFEGYAEAVERMRKGKLIQTL